MKVGNIVPMAEIEPMSLEWQVCVVAITPLRLPDVITLSMCVCLCGYLPDRSVQVTTLVLLELKVFLMVYVHK